jgi:hypothetical protein
MSQLPLKISLNGDHRRANLPAPTSFASVGRYLNGVWPELEHCTSTTLTYLDDDRDRITVASDSDLAEAFLVAKADGRKTLALTVDYVPLAAPAEPQRNPLMAQIAAGRPLRKAMAQPQQATAVTLTAQITAGKPLRKVSTAVVPEAALRTPLCARQALRTPLIHTLRKVPPQRDGAARQRMEQMLRKQLGKRRETTNAATAAVTEARASGAAIHAAVACDGCRAFPIVGMRWMSAVVPDFSLCWQCEAAHAGGGQLRNVAHRRQGYGPFLCVKSPEQAPLSVTAVFAAASPFAPSAAPEPAVLAPHHGRFRKYYQMAACRLPEGAVRHKMAFDRFSDADQAAFFAQGGMSGSMRRLPPPQTECRAAFVGGAVPARVAFLGQIRSSKCNRNRAEQIGGGGVGSSRARLPTRATLLEQIRKTHQKPVQQKLPTSWRTQSSQLRSAIEQARRVRGEQNMAAPPAPPTPPAPPAPSTQLKTLHAMGFYEDSTLTCLLGKHANNVQRVVQELLG